jgi:cell division protein FtsA
MPALIEDNLCHCIESQKRELEDVVFLPLAVSLGCLTPEDTELGVAVLDMGRSTTGLAVHRDRRILGTQCFDWGAYHLTRDVAAGLSVSFDEADELILEYGLSDEVFAAREAAGGDRLVVGLPPGPPTRRQAEIKLKTPVHGVSPIVPREELDHIIEERARELLVKVRQHAASRGLTKHLVRGVVLTGGGARIKNYCRLAEEVFEAPCRVGVPEGVEILPQQARGPEFSAAVGIARHGFHFRTAARNGQTTARAGVSSRAIRLGRLFRKYFF